MLKSHYGQQGHSAAVAVLRALGKFHGATWAWTNSLGGEEKLKEKYPLFFQELLDTEDGFRFMDALFRDSLKSLAPLTKVAGEEDLDRTILQSFGRYADPDFSPMAEVLEKLKSPTHFKGLSQSDCHSNNMMFKPDLASAKVLDFQLARYNSAVIDVAQYLCTSVKDSVLKEWKTLFNIYYQVVKETVELTGQHFPFTLNHLLEDFKTAQTLGLHLGLLSILGQKPQESYKVQEEKEGCNPEIYSANIENMVANNTGAENYLLAKKAVDLVKHITAIQPYNE